MNAPAPSAARAAAVAAAMDRIKGIEQQQGVTRAALDAIKAEMLELAAHEQLFPAAEFPPPAPGEKGSKRYLLQEEPDGRFAIYMLALNPGNETKPHDHTTWAVVVAVEGQELNRVYRRVDDGKRGGQGAARTGARGDGRARDRHRADAGGHPLHPHPRAPLRPAICTATGWRWSGWTTARASIRRRARCSPTTRRS